MRTASGQSTVRRQIDEAFLAGRLRDEDYVTVSKIADAADAYAKARAETVRYGRLIDLFFTGGMAFVIGFAVGRLWTALWP